MIPTISIVIPTFRRNDGLTNAVESIFALSDDACRFAEIVIVDNSPEVGAKETVDALSIDAPMPVVYVSETTPGVSNARNAGLAAARSDLIAFLDDDETAEQGWLDALLATKAKHDAAVVFGPVRTILPQAVSQHRDYFEGFFARSGEDKDTEIDHFFGCGNALLDLTKIRTSLPEGAPFFDALSNEIGGEDDFLFTQVEKAGHSFAWSANALVNEHVPASRAKLRYTLKRAFGYGQGPSTLSWRGTPPNIPGLIFWTCVGVGQALVYGVMAGGMYAVRAKRRAFMLDKAARGLGKILWFPPFELKFYGAASTTTN